MRVLLVTGMYPTPARPGFGGFVRDQVESLRALGGVEVEVFAIEGAGSGRWVAAARELRRRYRGERFDLVHAHYGLAGWSALAIRGVPHLVTFHGTDLAHPVVGRMSRALARIDRPPGARVGEPGRRRGLPGAGTTRPAPVLPTGVNLDRFGRRDRAEARARLGLDPGRPYLLFPADPARPEKRHDRARAAGRGDRRRAAQLRARGLRRGTRPDQRRERRGRPLRAGGLRAGSARGARVRRPGPVHGRGHRAGRAARHRGDALRTVRPRRAGCVPSSRTSPIRIRASRAVDAPSSSIATAWRSACWRCTRRSRAAPSAANVSIQPMMAFRNRAAEKARQAASGGDGPPAGQDPQVPGEPATPVVADRGAMRKRLRRTRRVRDGLLHELGALVMEMYRQDRHDPALVERKAREAVAVDSEARALSGALGRDEPVASLQVAGIAGPCSACGALLTREDRFCSRCGAAAAFAAGAQAGAASSEAPPPTGSPIAGPPPTGSPLAGPPPTGSPPSRRGARCWRIRPPARRSTARRRPRAIACPRLPPPARPSRARRRRPPIARRHRGPTGTACPPTGSPPASRMRFRKDKGDGDGAGAPTEAIAAPPPSSAQRVEEPAAVPGGAPAPHGDPLTAVTPPTGNPVPDETKPGGAGPQSPAAGGPQSPAPPPTATRWPRPRRRPRRPASTPRAHRRAREGARRPAERRRPGGGSTAV